MKKLYCVLISVSILLGSCAKDTHYLDAGADTGGNAGGGTSTAALEGTKWKMTSLIIGQEIKGQKKRQYALPSFSNLVANQILRKGKRKRLVKELPKRPK